MRASGASSYTPSHRIHEGDRAALLSHLGMLHTGAVYPYATSLDEDFPVSDNWNNHQMPREAKRRPERQSRPSFPGIGAGDHHHHQGQHLAYPLDRMLAQDSREEPWNALHAGRATGTTDVQHQPQAAETKTIRSSLGGRTSEAWPSTLVP